MLSRSNKLLQRVLDHWKSQTTTLPAIKQIHSGVLLRVWDVWREKFPLVHMRHMAEDKDYELLVGQALKLWQRSARRRSTFRAAARFGGTSAERLRASASRVRTPSSRFSRVRRSHVLTTASTLQRSTSSLSLRHSSNEVPYQVSDPYPQSVPQYDDEVSNEETTDDPTTSLLLEDDQTRSPLQNRDFDRLSLGTSRMSIRPVVDRSTDSNPPQLAHAAMTSPLAPSWAQRPQLHATLASTPARPTSARSLPSSERLSRIRR